METDAEVAADTRRIDVWVTPHEMGASPPDHLGLLGRITSGSGTVEFFHNDFAADLAAVVEFYDSRFEKSDLVAFLHSL